MKVKSPNNISKGHMGFNSAFKGLKSLTLGNGKAYERKASAKL
jgi:hypothetical protein